MRDQAAHFAARSACGPGDAAVCLNWTRRASTLSDELLFFPQEFLRAPHGFLFAQRSAGRRFGKNMPERVQRTVRPQDHRELLRWLSRKNVRARGRRECACLNIVRSGNPNSLAQIFVRNGIGDVHEDRSVVIRIGIQAPLAQDLIGLHAGGFRVDREFQVLADGLRIQTPDQRTSNKHQTARKASFAGPGPRSRLLWFREFRLLVRS